jgi:predicted PolB exonuclease-like 3'-5' exonuclease
MATPILVFDIETVPDVAGLRKLWELSDEVSDDAVVELVSQRRRQATGSDFFPTHLQRIVAISCVLRAGGETLRAWSVGGAEDGERELVKRFFEGRRQVRADPGLVERLVLRPPGAPLPRADPRRAGVLLLGPRRGQQGIQVEQLHQPLAPAPHGPDGCPRRLPEPRVGAAERDRGVVRLPGKLGMDGSQVWPAYKRGEIDAIRNYCETDVANTYLLYLRFQLMRGALTQESYDREVALFRSFLADQPAPHWKEFSEAWK